MNGLTPSDVRRRGLGVGTKAQAARKKIKDKEVHKIRDEPVAMSLRDEMEKSFKQTNDRLFDDQSSDDSDDAFAESDWVG